MGFWVFMLCCALVIVFIFLGGGWVMWKRCPGRNAFLGYRTERSMKNEETWFFANAYCGRLWWKLGWGMLIPVVLSLLLLREGSEEAVAAGGLAVMLIQLGIVLGTISATERALKRAFPGL